MLLAFALALVSTACTARAMIGGQCAFNGDCAADLVCAGTVCREACRDARDCPSNTTCAPSGQEGRRVCLPPDAPALCVYDSECPEGVVCGRDGMCRPPCRTDRDCERYGSGTRCMLPEGACSRAVVIGGTDAGSDAGADAATSDVSTPDVVTIEGGSGVGACGSDRLVDLTGVAPKADGLLHVRGSNRTVPLAPTVAIPGPCLAVTVPGARQVAYRYRYRTASFLSVTLEAGGTPTNFDTVLMALDRCAADGTVLACHDDVSMTDYRSRITLPLGQPGSEVYFIVGRTTAPGPTRCSSRTTSCSCAR